MKWENQKNLAVITLEFDRPIIWSIDTQSGSKKNDIPSRMVVDLMGVNPASTIRPGIKVQGSSLRRMRLDLSAPDKTRLLLDFRQVKRFMVKTESSPFRIVITTSATDAAMPRGISFGQGLQSSDPLFRFATRSIMIDPGHGGKDPGTVHNGVIEREVTLDIAKRVGSILAGKGIQVHYTRTDNTWVSLSTRSYMANQARADVLLSIHVNASPNESACGLETYFPDTASSSADAGKLAGLENANGGHKGDTGSPAASSSVRSQESRRLADTVQKCTLSVMKEKTFTVRDGGVKSGPFKVLLGANYRDPETGQVKIDPKRCMGCNYCITACPYDARWSNPLTGLPEKCMGEGCQKLVAEGKDPACVAACPTNARVFGDILDPKSAISREIASSRTVKLLEEKGTLPNFFVEVAK